mgnify:CR=1 FL=1
MAFEFATKQGVLEAATNSIGGYPIGFLIGMAVLPISANWIQQDPLMANMVITSIYVSVSFVRTLFLRKAFQGGLFRLLKKKNQTSNGEEKIANQ